MSEAMIPNVARPFLAAVKIASIAAASVLLAAQTVSNSTRPVLMPNQIAPGPVKHTLGWVPALMDHIKRCWSPAGGAPPPRVRIYFELRRDGTLAGPPRQVPGTSDGAPPALVQDAIQAIQKCQPYAFLPQSEYVGGWDRLDITFDIRKTLSEPGNTSTEPKPRGDASTTPGDAGQTPKWLSIMQPERKR